MDTTVLIIGAGAAGLMAAYELSAAGVSVTVLEAAERPGGRILTLEDKGFSSPVEAGAEFVHGSLPITLGLLQAAGISHRPAEGEMIRVRRGQWIEEDLFSDDSWAQLMQKMGELSGDIPIGEFLDTYFADERYTSLRSSVRGFAEGYDLADLCRASTLALYREWQEEGQVGFRVDGGYSRLVRYLEQQCLSRGCKIHYGSPVQDIRWQKGRVELGCTNGEIFLGRWLITTVSLGILQLAAAAPGALRFEPDIPAYREAALAMGYGSVIKVLMEFRSPFWENKKQEVGFILSDEAVPTWWTQHPGESNLLTAWIPATAMRNFQALDEAARVEACLQSLSAIFGVDIDLLKAELVTYSIHDWMTAPYIRGGYSYETVGSEAARARLRLPLQDTLFFAGEALYEGTALATVEAALQSGKDVAEKIKASAG
jgi:monoamine oxidase